MTTYTPATYRLPSRCAQKFKAVLSIPDPRLLVFSVSVLSVLSWLSPWQVVIVLALPALFTAWAALYLLPQGRGLAKTYAFFLSLWVVARLVLYLFEHPGAFADSLFMAGLLGARLAAMLGFALAIPLVTTPLQLGKTLSWLLHWCVQPHRRIWSLWPFRTRIRPLLEQAVWKSGLTLAVMLAFIPRAGNAFSALRTSIAMRCPHLPLHRKMSILGLGILRILSEEAWHMTLAIASRDLYRPEPWLWNSTGRAVPVEKARPANNSVN